MESQRNKFVEDLRDKAISEEKTKDESFINDVNNYIKIKNSMDMDDSATIDYEKEYIDKVINYFKNNKLNLNNIEYYGRSGSKIFDDGSIYINGDKIEGELYSKVCDIFLLNHAISKVFDKECELINYTSLNLSAKEDLNLEFNGNSKKKNLGGYIEPKLLNNPVVKIYEYSSYEDLAKDDPNVRVDACKEIFKSLFHEIEHHRQYLLMKNMVSDKDSLLYAKEGILKKELEDKFYSPTDENGNYFELAMENDANYVGSNKYSKVMDDYSGRTKDELEFYKVYKSESKYVIDFDSKDGKHTFKFEGSQEKEDAATMILDKIITEEYINKYPILGKEYNNDGTRKDTAELINNFLYEKRIISSINDISQEDKDMLLNNTNEMYYELIFRQLQRDYNNINDLVEKVGRKNITSILENISSYFTKEHERRALNTKILCQEKYLEDEKSDEIYEEDMNHLNTYYSNNKEFITKLEEKIDFLEAEREEK